MASVCLPLLCVGSGRYDNSWQPLLRKSSKSVWKQPHCSPVIAALSHTSLEYPNNTKIAVWLHDGNLTYLSSKHTPLFIAAMVCMIFLFLPYTTLLIIGQFLQAKSSLRIFSWINSPKLKPLLDAYHAPYADKHRYWTGLLLLVRLILYLVSAVNALGDPSVNLLAVAAITALLLISPTILGTRVYKMWSLGLLDASFILNLPILTAASFYVRLTGGNQKAATFTSVGVAFTMFTGIVVYHCSTTQEHPLGGKASLIVLDPIPQTRTRQACPKSGQRSRGLCQAITDYSNIDSG